MPTDPTGSCPPIRVRRFPMLPAGSPPRTHPWATAMGLLDRARAAGRSVGRPAGRRRILSLVLSLGLSTVGLVGCGAPYSGSQPGTRTSKAASAQQMVHNLEALLPQGKFSAQKGHGLSDGSAQPPSAQLIFDEGGRIAEVTVGLNRLPAPVPAQFLQCPDPVYHPHSQCTRTAMPGGAWLVRLRSPMDEDHPSSGEVLTALLIYRDGEQVLVSEAGSPEGKAAAGDTLLPLNLEQLSVVATSTVWEPVLSAMAAPPAGAQTGSAVTGQQIDRVIEQLLPTGLHVVQEGGSAGFGHVTVDDGHGKSLVAVNVQLWKPDDPDMAELFKKADTLPDGTRISVRKRPASLGGKGAVEWTVDTLRKDGRRVVISTVNAGGYHLPASRSEPALTIRQLEQIALNTAWQHVGAR
jgi:hypothetical protein